MVLTSRKKRQLDRTVPHKRDSRLIIIAAEGRKTEEQYFAMFHDTRVQVKVLSTGEDNRSAPNHVLARLEQYKQEFQLAGRDELWLMVDVDRYQLKPIAQVAKQKGFDLAISNPCFEVWLLCHFQTVPEQAEDCNVVQTLLRQVAGGSYNKSNVNVALFEDKVTFAVQTAKENDLNSKQRWPQNVGTHVYKVVESIQNSGFNQKIKS